MNAEEFRGAVGTVFITGWGDETPVFSPNSEKGRIPASDPYVEFAFDFGDSELNELTGPVKHEKTPGMVLIKVFVPTGKGDAAALTLADKAATIFRRKNVSLNTGLVRFRSPTVRPIGLFEGHYQVNVLCPFDLYAVH